MKYINSLLFARELDKKDPLKKFRKKFLFPLFKGKEALYFVGNSLGLQPASVEKYIKVELDGWAKLASEGHFEGRHPWYSYHEMFAKPVAKLVGALEDEVIVMNQLTVNLHLLMISFYKPQGKRYKIVCESNAFSSDNYALQTQVQLHGYDPSDAIIEVASRKGEHTLRIEDIIDTINNHAEEIAVVIFGGVNYLTGQLLDMPRIAQEAHKLGILCGFDLAHAAGNIELKLHDWDVDFAAWCTYKYLNSGPGAVAGAYIHQRHVKNPELLRLGGWWGYDKEKRFIMDKKFIPMQTAEGWQISNAPILSMAAHKAAIDIFTEAGGMAPLRKKSLLLTAYLEFIINGINEKLSEGIPLKKDKNLKLEIITPSNSSERGCQLSIIAQGIGKNFYNALTKSGVFCDWRNPNVIRLAPVPLYNSFEDVWKFGQVAEKLLFKGKITQ